MNIIVSPQNYVELFLYLDNVEKNNEKQSNPK